MAVIGRKEKMKLKIRKRKLIIKAVRLAKTKIAFFRKLTHINSGDLFLLWVSSAPLIVAFYSFLAHILIIDCVSLSTEAKCAIQQVVNDYQLLMDTGTFSIYNQDDRS